MIVVILAGTTGITFFIHTCSGSQKIEITAYPELFKHSFTCCCSDENTSQAHNTSQLLGVKAPPCCKNQHLFLKSYVSTIPAAQSFSGSTILFTVHPADLLLQVTRYKQPAVADYIPWLDHSPPWSGKTLVYFIHQIRIPSPVC